MLLRLVVGLISIVVLKYKIHMFPYSNFSVLLGFITTEQRLRRKNLKYPFEVWSL